MTAGGAEVEGSDIVWRRKSSSPEEARVDAFAGYSLVLFELYRSGGQLLGLFLKAIKNSSPLPNSLQQQTLPAGVRSRLPSPPHAVP